VNCHRAIGPEGVAAVTLDCRLWCERGATLFILGRRRSGYTRIDLKAFHQVVLSSGVVPLGQLRRNVQAWVLAQRY